MTSALQIAVLGAGNWGTTLAHVIANNGHAVRLWTRDRAKHDEINGSHRNQRAHVGLTLAPGVRAVLELEDALRAVDLIFAAVPSQTFRELCHSLAAFARPEHLLVHGIKGLEADSHSRMSQVLFETTCIRQFGVLAGPNIAREVAEAKPAGTVIATHFPRVAQLTRQALACVQLRVFDSSDVCGVELCGALKNVIAIGAGMADELGLGDNAKAFLITRALAELMRLAFALGAEPATMAGLAGIGDVMVTCSSPWSRNHRVGVALARGVPLASAIAEIGMVAEGVYASWSVGALARAHDLHMPVFEHIHRVLHEGLPVRDALAALMDLPTGRDVPHAARQLA